MTGRDERPRKTAQGAFYSGDERGKDHGERMKGGRDEKAGNTAEGRYYSHYELSRQHEVDDSGRSDQKTAPRHIVERLSDMKKGQASGGGDVRPSKSAKDELRFT